MTIRTNVSVLFVTKTDSKITLLHHPKGSILGRNQSFSTYTKGIDFVVPLSAPHKL
jgi:hypothetical protein